jgi:hypothetical protein
MKTKKDLLYLLLGLALYAAFMFWLATLPPRECRFDGEDSSNCVISESWEEEKEQ